jgi:hypothetical protein
MKKFLNKKVIGWKIKTMPEKIAGLRISKIRSQKIKEKSFLKNETE